MVKISPDRDWCVHEDCKCAVSEGADNLPFQLIEDCLIIVLIWPHTLLGSGDFPTIMPDDPDPL